MKKRVRRLFRGIFRLAFLALVILIGIITVKTVAFSSRQIPVEPVQQVKIDAGAAARLAQALQFPTVADEVHFDTAVFRRLDTFIHQQFPLLDSNLELLPVPALGKVWRWAGKNPKLPPILLTGHLDVVPVETSTTTAWTQPPFEGKTVEGYIWGRGSIDDKSSVFGILEAVSHLIRENYIPERTIYFAFGMDEEIGGQNGAMQIAAYFKKEGLQFEYTMDEGMLVLENALEGLDQPLAMIGIAEKGFATLDLTAHLEEGGHSSMPPRETAIGVLSAAIDKLQNHPFPASLNGVTGQLLSYIGPEMHFPYKPVFANLWLTHGLIENMMSGKPSSNATIRTTTAPTVINGGVKDNVLPSTATAKINFRILPGNSITYVREYVKKVIADNRIAVTLSHEGMASEASVVSPTNVFGFQVIEKTIRQLFPNTTIAPALVVGATDSRHYRAVCNNIYRFQPIQLTNPDLQRIHGIDERISVAGYEQMIRFYRQLIVNSCK